MKKLSWWQLIKFVYSFALTFRYEYESNVLRSYDYPTYSNVRADLVIGKYVGILKLRKQSRREVWHGFVLNK
jgi:hypothetical protein